jgi:lysozyme
MALNSHPLLKNQARNRKSLTFTSDLAPVSVSPGIYLYNIFMMKLSFATTALAYASANAFAINGDGVHCRSGPGTDSAIVKSYNKGQDVTLTCQAPGTSINGDTLWDKTTDGCFVADYYVQTGTSNYVAAHCSSGGGAPPGGDCEAPASNQATVDLIAEFEGFVDHVCE